MQFLEFSITEPRDTIPLPLSFSPQSIKVRWLPSLLWIYNMCDATGLFNGQVELFTVNRVD